MYYPVGIYTEMYVKEDASLREGLTKRRPEALAFATKEEAHHWMDEHPSRYSLFVIVYLKEKRKTKRKGKKNGKVGGERPVCNRTSGVQRRSNKRK